jgi:hypothetical protein
VSFDSSRERAKSCDTKHCLLVGRSKGTQFREFFLVEVKLCKSLSEELGGGSSLFGIPPGCVPQTK